MELDFSEFHPLTHRVGDKRCRSLPSARFRTPWGYHLHLAWSLKYKEKIRYRLHKHLLCKFGIHEMRECWYPKGKVHSLICMGCPKTVRLPWTDDPLQRFQNED